MECRLALRIGILGVSLSAAWAEDQGSVHSNPAQTSEPVPGTFQDNVRKGLASAIEPFVESQAVAGAVILVASKENVLDVEAVGFADLAGNKPMKTDNTFWVASLTKPMTAVALMMLVEEGKVNVDDPVEKYLPEFKGQTVGNGTSKEPGPGKLPRQPMTVKNLLNHTSGLPYTTSADKPTYDAHPLSERVRNYASVPLLSEPGSKYLYSNAGMNTAGRIIEVVSGMPYADFLEKRLIGPLGMKDTTFWPSPAQLQRLAKTYTQDKDNKGLREIPLGFFKYPLHNRQRQPVPAGGLFSTAEDLSLFFRMMAQGGQFAGRRYLSEALVASMTTNQTGDAHGNYGFGFITGQGEFRHGGIYGTHCRYNTRNGLVTICLTQVWGSPESRKILPAFESEAVKRWGAKPPKEKARHRAAADQPAAKEKQGIGSVPKSSP